LNERISVNRPRPDFDLTDIIKFKNVFSRAQATPSGFRMINLHDSRPKFRIGLDKVYIGNLFFFSSISFQSLVIA
jgi:hypothetical protein